MMGRWKQEKQNDTNVVPKHQACNERRSKRVFGQATANGQACLVGLHQNSCRGFCLDVQRALLHQERPSNGQA